MNEMTSGVALAALTVDVQIALNSDNPDIEEPPSAGALSEWARLAYQAVAKSNGEITIRLCGEDEMTALNREYRGFNKTTNVLSFPVDTEAMALEHLQTEMQSPLIGDVVICHNVIVQEAREQAKTVADHYAHIVTHGVLHLCGYDHQNDVDATQMEALEAQILAHSNIANPYQ